MTATSKAQTLPGAWPLVGHFPAYSRDPLGFVTTSVRTHGGVVPIRFGPSPALLITDSAAIEEVLVTRHRDFQKGRAGRRVGVVVGDGILLSEGETWREHRRIVQPAFHHDRVTAWAETMVEETERHLATWADGDIRDVHADMSALTLADRRPDAARQPDRGGRCRGGPRRHGDPDRPLRLAVQQPPLLLARCAPDAG